MENVLVGSQTRRRALGQFAAAGGVLLAGSAVASVQDPIPANSPATPLPTAPALAVDPEETPTQIAVTRELFEQVTAPVMINGKGPFRFMVDTGASSVALGMAEAERIGLAYRSGQPVRIGTANGVVQGWRIKLASVRIGDVEVYEVDAVVTPQGMPFVLLGNSYLNRFQMRRDNDQMVLERRF